METPSGGVLEEAKYDRQLRLWGEDGQRALKQAHIAALGATTTVVEALKNLVLTGVGVLTVVDERVVDSEQIGTNFFVEEGDLGRPTAIAVAERLGELNSDCCVLAATVAPVVWAGSFVAAAVTRAGASASSQSTDTQQSTSEFDCTASVRRTGDAGRGTSREQSPTDQFRAATCLRSSPSDVPSLIIVSNRYLDFSTISELVRTARPLRIPVLCVETKGLLGFVQTHLVDRVVIHARAPAEQAMEDLRIFDPFPELKDWFEKHDPMIDLGQPDDAMKSGMSMKSHLPYLCILYHAFKRWHQRMQDDGVATQAPRHLPFTADEYKQIRGEVESMAACCADLLGVGFTQAIELCTERLNRPALSCPPAALQALFSDPRCNDPLRASLHRHRHSFRGPDDEYKCEDVLVWFVIQAIRTFYNGGSIVGSESGRCSCAPAPGARHVLPFCGYVPDFMTSTEWYQELRSIYHNKFCADVQRVADLAFAEWRRRRCETNSVATAVSILPSQDKQDDIRGVLYALAEDAVKNVWSMRLVRFSPGYVVGEPAEGSDLVHEAAVGNRCTPVRIDINGDTQLRDVDIEAAWRLRLGSRIRKALDGIDDLPSDGARRTLCFGVSLLATQEWTRRRGSHPRSGMSCKNSRLTLPSAIKSNEHDTGHVLPSDVFSFLKELISLEGVDTRPGNAEVQDCKDVERLVRGFVPFASQVSGPSFPSSWDVLSELLQKCCLELERVGLTEIISVAASVGALASQEAVKLVQRRLVPAGHPLVYSGYDNIVLSLKT